MNRLLFATNNLNKLQEVKDILKDQYEIISLHDLGHIEELAEDGTTLEENALQKARFINDNYGLSCFAEDTGLEVKALNNEPGVYSARYAGPQRSHSDNMNLLLKNLEGIGDREARFRTVIALILNGKEYLFEGVVKGSISREISGNAGFGYDPIFIPDNNTQTFGELAKEIKNTISHRSEAIRNLVSFLKTL